jgi:serine/threonine-protein kinase
MRRIGRYEILGLLGRGGMGAVYKAAAPLTGRMVAVKLCRPAEIMADVVGLEECRRLFLREAVTMARVRHPHIAQILDVDECEAGPFFVMEYFCNNLGVVLGEDYEMDKPCRRLPVDAGLRYARQMLAALRRLHHEGVVHRDLKPFNVMLADWGEGVDEVKLIDFGLSRLRGEVGGGHKGMVVGSPFYTAPEQERDPDGADGRADLFSIGVSLYRMITGFLPDENIKLRKNASELNPELDSEFDAFLVQAMSPSLEERFASAGDMLAALDRLCVHWESAKDAACSLLEPEEPGSRSARGRPRSAPLKAGVRQARQVFGLDALWRPVQTSSGDLLDQGDGTVLDRSTGLTWERGGSDYPLAWDQALEHPAWCNARRLGGRADWRLPTLDELGSLFAGAPAPGHFCLEPVFDPTKRRLWSRDTKSFVAAWYVDAETGFIWWQDMTCGFHARAVSG